jgi:chromosome segregation protein
LRSHSRLGVEGPGAATSLSDELSVKDGYELALAAVLGGRLDAALVSDVAGAQAILDRAGPDGGTALLSGEPGRPVPSGPEAPTADAERMLDLLKGPPAVMALAGRLLSDAWVGGTFVDRAGIEACAPDEWVLVELWDES